VQLPETATVAPQVVVSLKLLAFVPVIVIPVTSSTVPPELVSVTVCAVAVAPANMLGNAIVVALSPAAGAAGELLPPPHPAIQTIPPTIPATIASRAARTADAENPRGLWLCNARTRPDNKRPGSEEKKFMSNSSNRKRARAQRSEGAHEKDRMK
jgi:hypothetical protein